VIQPAALAPEAGEAVGEDAAREELPELVLHEAGQAGAAIIPSAIPALAKRISVRCSAGLIRRCASG
jgi:hypothetical protein